ncbi:MAG: hypothetical protein BRC58_10145 [Cyanobacteria bacterium QS_8_64_29]|nr:MAG: hypothetical protein BRC58_10145 [Cyanobacteria bacterium QS_8_64_29]
MLTTTELRWFLSGLLPAAIRQWFRQQAPGELVQADAERTDWYLAPAPPCPALNLKQRQGAWELKWRQAQLGALPAGTPWQGELEQWVKWRCEAERPEAIALTPAMQARGPWVAVRKSRSLRRLSLASGTSCELELTQLQAGDRWGWTLALEASGAAAQLQAPLQAAAAKLARSYPELALEARQSYAYPSWLAAIPPSGV